MRDYKPRPRGVGRNLMNHPLVFIATPMYFGVIGSIAWGYVRGGIAKLPATWLSKVLTASLAAGSMTPERVLETVTPELLAKHLPHEVLWACIAAAVARAGVTNAGAS